MVNLFVNNICFFIYNVDVDVDVGDGDVLGHDGCLAGSQECGRAHQLHPEHASADAGQVAGQHVFLCSFCFSGSRPCQTR